MLMYMMAAEGWRNKLRYGQLVLRYEKLMFYVANRILHNEMDAEDALQEAFLSIAKNFSKISALDANKMRSYLVTTVERKAIDIYRTKKTLLRNLTGHGQMPSRIIPACHR